jgi:predicted MFS family arabinose efflux permease
VTASARPIHYVLLVIGGVACLINGSSTATIASFETLFVSEMGLSHAQVGAIVGAVFVGNLVGSLLLARFAHGLGLKTLGLLALGLMVAGNVLSGNKALPMLVVGRALMGASVSGVVVFLSTLVVHHFASRQAALISVSHGLMAASSCLAVAFSRRLADDVFGDWPQVYWLIAAIAAVPLLALLVTPCREPVGGEPFEARGIANVVRHPALWPVALVLMAYIVAEAATATYFASFAEKHRGLEPETAVTLTAVFWVGVVLGRLSMVALVHVVREKTLIVAGATVGGVVLIVATLLHARPAMACCLFAGGFLIGPTAPVSIALVVDRIGRFKPAVLAITNLLLCVGGLIGPPLIGLVADGVSLRTAIITGSLAMPMAVLPMMWRLSGTTSGESKVRGAAGEA